MANDWLMTFRPLAQMLNLFVVPEIDRRIAAGLLSADMLPFRLHQLRIVQPGGANRVELNEEAQLAVEVKTKRPVAAGEALRLADIDPEHCFLKPPEVDGKPASSYLVQSAFLSVHSMFDFTQDTAALPGTRSLPRTSQIS